MFLLWSLLVSRRWRLAGTRRAAGALLPSASALALALAALTIAPGAAGASVGSDRNQVNQLEQQIATTGAKVQAIVSHYDAVQGHLDAIDLQIVADHVRLRADHRSAARATLLLRRVAIEAYVTGAGLSSSAVGLFTGSENATSALEQTAYVDAADGNVHTALATWQFAQSRTEQAQSALGFQKARAATTLVQLSGARSTAENAIATEEAMLTNARGNLQAALAAANRQHQHAELATERALAAASSPPIPPLPTTALTTTTPPTTALTTTTSTTTPPTTTTTSTTTTSTTTTSTTTTSTTTPGATTTTTTTPASPPPPPPPSPATPGPSGYTNPLQAVSVLSPERIDQGVDYSGFGPIYAIGAGIVLSTVNAGWPGGTFIVYQLTSGPGAGLDVYAAEDIEPTVQVGQTVAAGTVLGQVYEGPTGIETGWADPSALGESMASAYGQFSGANSTAFGNNFSQLLQFVGAPGGVLQNNPPTGSLPATWPQW